MQRVIAATAIALMMVPGAVAAKDKGHGKGHGKRHQVERSYQEANRFCPPGLAKKSPACVPPGQAKKHDSRRDRDEDRHHHRYRAGDRIIDYNDLVLIRDPGRYALDPYGTYYRSGDYVIRVDRQTNEVLSLIGLATAILGG
ncbi:hypothetical protein ATO6_15820 [Oceanicola sp. 22II-s10i]|uniref:excinuclease ABC subunit A n=1 Tax=Oceanicola sp. 22II-s10i TaxID=1317116 RepID=UPI000B67B105|nr:excinuclease ABC subunit A [Oceanicola sp. 22II-s10i]OWU83884.1 hypothetical protein ATO6_15820 [Oceanicola sp. 22II-s10i]